MVSYLFGFEQKQCEIGVCATFSICAAVRAKQVGLQMINFCNKLGSPATIGAKRQAVKTNAH